MIPRAIDSLPLPSNVCDKKLLVFSKGRTGTFSLYQALQILGYKPYHMMEVVNHGPLHMQIFEEALLAKYFGQGKPYGKAEFDRWFAQYDSIVEIAHFFFDELLEAYPDAKIIHFERDVKKWHKSMENTAKPMFRDVQRFPLNAVSMVDSWIHHFCSLHITLDRVWYHGQGFDAGGEIAQKDYIALNNKVRLIQPASRRLIVSLEDEPGWEAICPFLGKKTPSVAYPRGNAPKEFKKLANQLLVPRILRGMAVIVSSVVIPVAAAVAFYYWRY